MEAQGEAVQDTVTFAHQQDTAMRASLPSRGTAGQDGGLAAEGSRVGVESSAPGEERPGPEGTLDANQTQWQQRMMVCGCQQLY